MHEARPLWSATAPENNRGAVPWLQDTWLYPLVTSPLFLCSNIVSLLSVRIVKYN
jgi:hypothetical protein